ncbi:DNA sulfur modification protein DndB, partial [Escherichia coli]
LYDHRDVSSNLARYLAMSIEPFVGLTELEKSSISALSNKLFTLSSIKQATRALLGKDPKLGNIEENTNIASVYWQTLYS